MLSNQACPFRLGDRVVFSPSDRAFGWSYPTFDRIRLKPGDVGTVTRIDKEAYIYVDDDVYSYVYDRFGNRWQQNGPHSMLLTFTGNNPGNPANNNRVDGYSCDSAGNLLGDGNHSYFYDAENRLIQVDGTFGNCSTATACYIYDAIGRRVRKTARGTSVDYLYDLADRQITEFSSAGVWTRGELYAGGKHVATYSNSTTYFIHADWLNTERVRTTVSAGIYQTCASLPFGDALSCSGSDASPLHFTGKERDSESGLDNSKARYLGSPLGRFMSPDPSNLSVDFWLPQTWNRYSYALNNPLAFVDRNGMWPTHIHNEIINEAFPGLSKDQLNTLQKASHDTHFHQLPPSSYEHKLRVSIFRFRVSVFAFEVSLFQVSPLLRFHYHTCRTMKRGPFILVITLAVVAFAIALGVAILHDGLSTRATPSRLEAFLARHARRLAIPSNARSLANPVSLTPQILREGRLHFADHCAVCHDNNGDGETLFGQGLYPHPPDLRKFETQNLSDGELFWIIENGVRFTGMPAFSGHGAAEDDTWKLVHFIRHLPHLAPEELVEMDRYNPKGPEDREEEQQEEDFLGGDSQAPAAKPSRESASKPRH